MLAANWRPGEPRERPIDLGQLTGETVAEQTRVLFVRSTPGGRVVRPSSDMPERSDARFCRAASGLRFGHDGMCWLLMERRRRRAWLPL